MTQTLLYFGTTGQVGTQLSTLDQPAFRMVGVSRQDADITSPGDVARIMDALAPAVVVNCAAYTAVDRAESEPEAAVRANQTGPAVLALACAARGIPLIHLSTDYVFDGSKNGPYIENDAIAPLGVYGTSKAAGEQAIRERWDRHIILRTAWVYGPSGQNFLKTMLRLAGERDGWKVVDDQHGNPTATLDLAAAIMAGAEKAASGVARWGTYHFAGAGEATWFEFASDIIENAAHYTGRHPSLVPVPTSSYPTAAKRPANSRLDSRLFAEHFGVCAKPWRQRTREIVDTLMRQERATQPTDEV